jgi:MSHA pilin protein MshC
LKRQSGFTLIELVTTLIIIGALSVVAYAKFNPATFEVRTAADELLGAIRYAQERSMSNSGLSSYSVSINGQGYVVNRDGGAVTHPVTGNSTYSNNWSAVSISPTATLSFDGNGDPGLASPLVLTLQNGSESASITVENLTGFAR